MVSRNITQFAEKRELSVFTILLDDIIKVHGNFLEYRQVSLQCNGVKACIMERDIFHVFSILLISVITYLRC